MTNQGNKDTQTSKVTETHTVKKNNTPLIIFAVLVAFLAVGLTLDPKEIPSPLIGKPASQFELPQMNSDAVFSPKLMLGKPWILNIWASWCVSCRQEHKLLVNFSKQDSTPIVGLNYKDTQPEAGDWLKELGNPYSHVVLDDKGRAGIEWGVYGVPETFVMDANGIIRHKFTGPLTRKKIEYELMPLLKTLNKEMQTH